MTTSTSVPESPTDVWPSIKPEIAALLERIVDRLTRPSDLTGIRADVATAYLTGYSAALGSFATAVLTPDDPSLPPDIDAELAQHTARDVEVFQSCPAIHPRDRQRCYDVAGHEGRHYYECGYDEPYDVYWDAAEAPTDPQPTPAAGTPLPVPPGSRMQMPATAIWGRNALEVWPEAGETE